MSDTTIEWTDKVWNPVTGCTKVSQGCKNCYAERVFPRAYGRERKFTDVRAHHDRLTQPLHWRKPARIFVNSMSDLFHEDVSYDFISQVFSTMVNAPRHSFQILTKRPERMQDFMVEWLHNRSVACDPPENVWLGVSVENQDTLGRIEVLKDTPAAVRFVSFEPLLEDLGELTLDRIHWAIIGGESGPHARPMHPDWVRSIRDQCQAAGVAYFFKQWGEILHRDAMTDDQFSAIDSAHNLGNTVEQFFYVGKKYAGRLLDGREWNEFPQ